MANFIVREGRQRMPDIDRIPDRKLHERMARANVPNLKFKSEGHERDYRRQIAANPRNIYGGPEFFPPVEIKEFVSTSGALTEEEEMQIAQERMNRKCSGVIPLPCPDCVPHSHSARPDKDGVTPHWIAFDMCKCQLCGKDKPFRVKFFRSDVPMATSHASAT